jgi:hypothetical protein
LSESDVSSQRIRLRIENLSDLVFGLALSLGSIILVSASVTTPADLITNIALFGFSFLIVIWVWSGYNRTMAVLPFEIRGTFVLNIVLLFCVAIEPYLFYVLFQYPKVIQFASSVYALDGGAMMIILAGMTYLLLGEEKVLAARHPGFNAARFRRVMNAEVVSGAIFWSSALPPFWIPDPFGNYLRFDLWYIVFIVFFIVLGLKGGSARNA